MKRFLTIALACLAMLCALCSCGNKSGSDGQSYVLTKADTYQETLDNLIKSMNEADGAQYVSLQYPDALVGIMQRDGKFSTTASSADSFLAGLRNEYIAELGDDVQASIKGEVSSTELTEEQKTAASDYFKYLAQEQGYDLKKLEITEAYEVSLTIQYVGSKGSAESPETWCAVNVGNGGWKIIVLSAAQLVDPTLITSK